MGAQPSPLGAAARLIARGLRARGRDAARAPLAPARRVAVERGGIQATRVRVQRYLAATRGGEWESDVVPPTYSAVWETALLLELLGREELPFPSGGVIHLGSEIVVVRPLRLEDAIRCRVELERSEEVPAGWRLRLRCRSWNGPGLLCQENATEILVRRGGGGGGSLARSAEARGAAPPQAWETVAAWRIDAAAGRRYARASGDFNPVHLWGWTARPLGFARPILHGHCTLAMIAHELLRARGTALNRLQGTFRAPLLLPASVRLDTAENRYRLVEAEGGKTVAVGEW